MRRVMNNECITMVLLSNIDMLTYYFAIKIDWLHYDCVTIRP